MCPVIGNGAFESDPDMACVIGHAPGASFDGVGKCTCSEHVYSL